MNKKESLVDYWKKTGTITDKKVLDAFLKIPRENFMPKNLKEMAYEDNAFPILAGQTISQPTTVLIMTQALEVKPNQKILEIGAGSGYQASLLSILVGNKGKVITTEIIPELCRYSKEKLKNYRNVKVILHDGSQGYEKEAPYDRIIVTAACKKIPQPLIDQLKNNGILVIPVGSYYLQKMLKIVKHGRHLEEAYLGDFVFVELKGKYS